MRRASSLLEWIVAFKAITLMALGIALLATRRLDRSDPADAPQLVVPSMCLTVDGPASDTVRLVRPVAPQRIACLSP